LKNSKLNNRIISGTMLQQDQKIVAKIKNNTQSEVPAKLSDSKILDAFLNSVNPYLISQKEGRVTAAVTKAMHHKATKNQTKQRHEHSARSSTSNTVIKILLDSRSDGDLMFHEKGTSMHFPYLTRQVPTSWHTSNGNFLTKGRSKVNTYFLITQTARCL
jgi:hypothetical protein